MARIPVLAAALALAAFPALAGPCEEELERQSAAAGIPEPLARALASSLAIGAGGSMHPWAVEAGGRVLVESSARSAARAASDLLRRGAPEVRVGCLGASLQPGIDEDGILRAIAPAANIASALAGIGGGRDGIGAALEAISAGAPPPPPAAEAAPAPEPLPVTSLPPRMGSIGGGWSLFADRAPRPLTNP